MGAYKKNMTNTKAIKISITLLFFFAIIIAGLTSYYLYRWAEKEVERLDLDHEYIRKIEYIKQKRLLEKEIQEEEENIKKQQGKG